MLLQVSFNVFLMKINWLEVDFDSIFFYIRLLESFRLSFLIRGEEYFNSIFRS